MNARSTHRTIEVTVAEGAVFAIRNAEGARMDIEGPETLIGMVAEVRGLLWVVFPTKRSFGIALERPLPKEVRKFEQQKADDLRTAVEDKTVEAEELLPGGMRRNVFDELQP